MHFMLKLYDSKSLSKQMRIVDAPKLKNDINLIEILIFSVKVSPQNIHISVNENTHHFLFHRDMS